MGRWFVFGLWMLGLTLCASAQDQVPVPDHLVTLHAYANLIQLPTMVLDRWGDPVKERPRQKFMISLDSGKPFPATHVRLEGEDPITLSILIDASGSQKDLLYELPNAMGKLLPAGLNPRDHVSVYAMDCKVVRTLTDMPASADALRKAATEAINAPGLHGGKADPPCGATRRLWDTVVYVMGQMQTLPGRRVILAITDGKDTASKRYWKELRLYAQNAGVAIFGLAGGRDGMGLPSRSVPVTSEFDAVCQGSGGKMLTVEASSLTYRLRDFVKIFPRSKTIGPGSHDIVISVVGQNYLIRPAGISVPIAGPQELAPQPLSVEEPAPLAAPPAEPTPPDYFR